MTCSHCVASVTEGVSALHGAAVSDASVDTRESDELAQEETPVAAIAKAKELAKSLKATEPAMHFQVRGAQQIPIALRVVRDRGPQASVRRPVPVPYSA